WLTIWLAEAVAAFFIGGWAANRKAQGVGMPLFLAPGRKIALSLAPPMLVGALLTAGFFRGRGIKRGPGVGVLFYRTGGVTGGAFSVKIVPVMGICFMVAGAAALFLPPSWGDAFMAFGFGVLHIFFGIIIARRHGG